MGKTLYLDCSSGISGDMTVGALLDLGADYEHLKEQLKSLKVSGYRIDAVDVMKSSIRCKSFEVIPDVDNHDHDMAYLFGHLKKSINVELSDHDDEDGSVHDHDHDGDHEHVHEHDDEHDHGHVHVHSHEHNEDNAHAHEYDHEHDHEHEHSHEHGHGHSHEHTHDHVHVGLKEIEEIIDSGNLNERTRDTARKIFGILADAEAKAHGTQRDKVHFHEVGAVDSIVDIVSVAVCMDNLDIDKVIVEGLTEGRGSVRCQHGILPVPVPAVMNIVTDHGIPLTRSDILGELVTPTGAAIVAALRTDSDLPKRMIVKKVGLGAGKREYERPSILRAMLIEEDAKSVSSDIVKLESNIDDSTGECLGYVSQRLMEAGARDVYYTPVFMKKGRPAYQLNVICTSDDADRLSDIIFLETTTIGIRKIGVDRYILPRKILDCETPYGTAKIKVCDNNGRKEVYPEYESVTVLCMENGVPYKDMYAIVRDCGIRYIEK
ncbi:MAG: nickel pincer cofactor biosynthesis protein LarC [Lachnospiraceae bacterium]|nr:nickel pincer cofactor biosynthesis protein LarC [Lachnospiraceae bacterium]